MKKQLHRPQSSSYSFTAFCLLPAAFCLLLAMALPGRTASPPTPQSCQNALGLEMHLIPEGAYFIGSPPQELGRYLNEGPQHRIRLPAFHITTTEITNDIYGLFLNATGHTPPLYWLDKNLNSPTQPVVGVTWYDAVAFAAWLSRQTGETYSLPTEAQWEVAARGGLVAQAFPWGSEDPDNGDKYLANYNPNAFDEDGYRYTAPVGRFPANGYGLFDMAGNVAEWCLDWYDANYYARSPLDNPLGPSRGKNKVLRGGSWFSRSRDLRCASRQFAPPQNADGFIGFRLVRLLK